VLATTAKGATIQEPLLGNYSTYMNTTTVLKQRNGLFCAVCDKMLYAGRIAAAVGWAVNCCGSFFMLIVRRG
jgi:hypothetical protein